MTSRKWRRGSRRIDSRGGTAMRDAIIKSIDYLKEKGNGKRRSC